LLSAQSHFKQTFVVHVIVWCSLITWTTLLYGKDGFGETTDAGRQTVPC